MAGRPRLSDQAKLAKGTLRPNRVNKLAPALDAIEIPEPPPDYPAVLAATWRRLSSEIGPARVVATSDLPAWRLLVSAYALAEETAADDTASVGEKSKATSAALVALGQFGATPSTRERARMAPPKPPRVDPLDEFLS